MAKKGEYKSLTGMRFGMWLVGDMSQKPYRDPDGRQHSTEWWCTCDCGTVSSVAGYSLKSGESKSCGCRCSGDIGLRSVTHGMRDTPEYGIWGGIKSRTSNPNNKSYKDYGSRHITMCHEWLNDFEAFYQHVGPRPSEDHSIERVDNEKGYQPGNVVWALRATQANNKRNSLRITIDGVTQTLAQWCHQLGRSYKTVHARIQDGWNPVDAIMTPAGGCYGRRPKVEEPKPPKE